MSHHMSQPVSRGILASGGALGPSSVDSRKKDGSFRGSSPLLPDASNSMGIRKESSNRFSLQSSPTFGPASASANAALNAIKSPQGILRHKGNLSSTKEGVLQVKKLWGHRFDNIRLHLRDPFASLVNVRWWKLILLFQIIFFISWCIWTILFIICVELAYGENGCSVCISNIATGDPERFHITQVFSFVVATMSTVGYGDFTPTCAVAQLFVCLLVVYGVLLEVLAVGITFAKFSYPFARSNFIEISHKLNGYIPTKHSTFKEPTHGLATVVSFRLMNLRQHTFYFPDIRCYLVDTITGEEGLPRFTHVDYVTSTPLDFLELPCVVSVVLTNEMVGVNYEMAPSAMSGLHLFMRFSAIDPVTGNCFQYRKTWSLATDVQWGFDFAPILEARFPDVDSIQDLEDQDPNTLLSVDVSKFQNSQPTAEVPSWASLAVAYHFEDASKPQFHQSSSDEEVLQ